MMDGLVKGVRWLLMVTRTVSGICLLASVAINFVNIIGRYFFSVSIPWAEEIMLFLMVGCVFTGCCAVAWEGRQIRMDVVVGMLPAKVREFLALLSELVMIATAAAVTAFAWPVIAQLAAFDERSQAVVFLQFRKDTREQIIPFVLHIDERAAYENRARFPHRITLLLVPSV